MTQPKFHILDIVEAPVVGSDEATRGVVVQVRSFPDGRFRYSVGPLSNDREYIGGIYDEEMLKGTGVKEDAERYVRCDPFHVRDVVIIANECWLPEFACKTGVIKGSTWEDDSQFLVWFEDLKKVAVFGVKELTPTGERRPPGATGPRTSSQINSDGELVGKESYVVTEDVSDL